MDLEEFVSTALVQAANGVHQAQLTLGMVESNAVINPAKYFSGSGMGQEVIHVEFDVALTVKEEASHAGGGKLAVAAFASFGGEKKQVGSQESVSRIKFNVPVKWSPAK